MKLAYTSLIAFTVLSSVVQAAPMAFDFKDPKGVNNVVFQLDAPLESINGTANGIAGTVTVDPDDASSVKGKITVATSSLTVPNSMMQEHLLGEKWLNAKGNPEISFEIKSVANTKKDGEKGTADVTGAFSLNGVTKEITVPAKVSYLPGKLADRTGGKVQGDLLVVRTSFTIKRSDYNIQAGQNLDKVSDEVLITLSIAGAAPKN